MMKTETKQKQKKVSQLVSCRIDSAIFKRYEEKCIEEQITMSKLIKDGIVRFISTN